MTQSTCSPAVCFDLYFDVCSPGLTKSVGKMHVYLKDGHQRRWVRDVHLEDGFYPCIGNSLTHRSGEVVSRSLEPAIWFKVLVLESVSVDCGRRIVSWSMGSDSEGQSICFEL